MRQVLTYIILFLLCRCTPAQISPGDLSKAHAHLEGISNCTKCHVMGRQVYSSKCLDCHTEIKNLMNSGKGYHSHSEVRGKDCWDCHSEHHGRNFRIVNFYEDLFKHNKTQFPLTGQHRELKCVSCHQSKFISEEKIKNKKNTFLGLEGRCASCHYDYHQTTLGANCAFCHTTEGFRPASKFNHDNSQFKLTGAHTAVQCISCHSIVQREGKAFQRFKGVAVSGCVSCHRDVHSGKFGNDCQSCHTTSSFHQINRNAFNHNKTDFPLLGRHQRVSCSSCHKTSITARLDYQQCTDCHSDFHKGDFRIADNIKDCSECHSVNGFRPSSFTIDDHNKIEFKLTGSHLAVPCRGCHFQDNEWHFKIENNSCINCHQNVHREEISEKIMPGNDCSKCHQTAGWNTISFEHNETGFPLLGKHQAQTCRNCHIQINEDGISTSRFASLNNNCEDCHNDTHGGQFEENGNSGCIRCHSFDNWKPVNFDHNRTKFPLAGAHEKLQCSACHKKIVSNGTSFVKYKIEYFQCSSCHS